VKGLVHDLGGHGHRADSHELGVGQMIQTSKLQKVLGFRKWIFCANLIFLSVLHSSAVPTVLFENTSSVLDGSLPMPINVKCCSSKPYIMKFLHLILPFSPKSGQGTEVLHNSCFYPVLF
jgi:hypothetical protein